MANTGHSSPESCRGVRKGAFEALTGEDVGEPLSRARKKQSERVWLRAARRGQAAEFDLEAARRGQAAKFDLGVHHRRLARNWQERQSDDLTWKGLTSKSAT